MATYQELYDLRSDSALKNRVNVAVIVAAEAIRVEDVGTPNHTNRLVWAAAVFAAPAAAAGRMFMSILAANKDANVAAIQTASDAAIQSQVDGAVDLFATG